MTHPALQPALAVGALAGLSLVGLSLTVGGCGGGHGSPQTAARLRTDLPDTPFPVIELGAIATVHDDGENAFGYPSPHLAAKDRRAFMVGNSFFKQNWVQAPASAAGRDGLGPLFDARSCSTCHFKDGRGRPPEGAERHPTGLLLKLNVPGPDGFHQPHPVYGGQLQPRAIGGVEPEARFELDYASVPGAYPDGAPYELQRPVYTIVDARFGPLGDDLVISPRVASQVIGMGLLEAVP